MARIRYIASGNISPDTKRIVLSGEEFHHLIRVIRAREGARATVLDGVGGIFEATVRSIDRHEAVLTIESYRKGAHPPTIDMALALTKAHRLEIAVEKCSEIGARAIIPFVARRSVWRGGAREAALKGERLRRKVVSACKQSGNPYFPVVDPVSDVAGIAGSFDRYGAVYLADPGGVPVGSEVENDRGGAVLGIVGPEGGLTDDEREQLVAAGAVPVALGPYELRSETATICLLSRLCAPNGG